ncbi:hypothetical protein RND81_07G102400 [Saponaria officinalis]|uniref:Uncharacterized protein n=1 Tax=Saponaria officinalis TaxID=3572 RepID=A0AAW1JQD5_SAPOF
MQPQLSAGITSEVNHEDSIKLIALLNRKRKSVKNTNDKTEKRKCTRDDTSSTVLDHNDTQDSSAEDLHDLIMALKTETKVFLVRYNYLVSEIKKKNSPYAPTESVEPAEASLTPTQAFFADPELHRYVDEIVEISKAMKASNDRCPSLVKLSQRSGTVPAEKEEVGVVFGSNSSEMGHFPANDGQFSGDPGLNELQADQLVTNVLNNLGRSGRASNDKCTNDDVSNSSVTYMLCHATLHYPYLLHSKTLLSCTVIVPVDMGCTCDCGGRPDPNQLVVSDFLLSHRDLMSPIFSIRKQVIDYCFTDDHTLTVGEILVRYGDQFFLARSDLLTLLPGDQICSNVLDCWSILLNWLMALKKAHVNASRAFFGTSHT